MVGLDLASLWLAGLDFASLLLVGFDLELVLPEVAALVAVGTTHHSAVD